MKTVLPALVRPLIEARLAAFGVQVTGVTRSGRDGTVTPEPLPADDPLWSVPGIIHSVHLSGRSQTRMFARGADLFLRNLDAFLTGQPMANVVDLRVGY